MPAPATQLARQGQRSLWRAVAHRGKHSPTLLRLANTLGRGTGRFRVLDLLHRPRAARPLPHTPLPDTAALAIGHATVLFRLAGLHLLTDPVFSPRIGLGLGILTAGPARHIAPAIPLTALPKLDALLISHAHFDHLDRPSLRRLARNHPHATAITAPGCGDLLTDLGFREVRELAWGHRTTLGPVTLTGIPVKHWGARVFADTHRGYCAFLLESPQHRILFGADSAFFDGWKPLGDAGGVDLACVGIGAYDPYLAAHATPEQALDMAQFAGASAIMPIHHGVFRLSHEPMDEPLRRLRTAAAQTRIRLSAEEPGGLWTPPA